MKIPQDFDNRYKDKRVGYGNFYFIEDGYNKTKGDMIYYPQGEVSL